LSQATVGTNQINYLYNGLGQRVSKQGPVSLVASGRIVIVHDEAGRLIGEYDAALRTRQETVYLGDTPVAVLTQSTSGTTTPVDAAPASHARFGAANGLPRCYGESASTSNLSRPARCSLTLLPAWPAGSLKKPFQAVLQPIRYLLDRSLCFRPERELAGSDFHRRINRAFARHHNNRIENRIRPVAIGRSNWLFAGSLRGGQRAAAVMSLIQSARLNGHDPYAYLRDVLERLPSQPNSRIDELLPHLWTPASAI
jgi:hypothetical protein